MQAHSQPFIYSIGIGSVTTRVRRRGGNWNKINNNSRDKSIRKMSLLVWKEVKKTGNISRLKNPRLINWKLNSKLYLVHNLPFKRYTGSQYLDGEVFSTPIDMLLVLRMRHNSRQKKIYTWHCLSFHSQLATELCWTNWWRKEMDNTITRIFTSPNRSTRKQSGSMLDARVNSPSNISAIGDKKVNPSSLAVYRPTPHLASNEVIKDMQ